MIAQIARAEGFSTADVALKPLQKVGAIIGALKSGQIDGWSIVPHIAKALHNSGGAKIIGDVADYIDGYQVTTVFTSTRNATENKDLTKRFLAAYSKGIAHFNAAMVDKTQGPDGQDAATRLIHKYVYASRPLRKGQGSNSSRIDATATQLSAEPDVCRASVGMVPVRRPGEQVDHD